MVSRNKLRPAGRFALALALSALAAHTARAQAAPRGYWQGLITREGRQWRVSMEFAADGAKASVDFPDVGGYGREFTVSPGARGIRLERPQPGGNPIVFEGSLEGDRFEGEWSGLGVTAAFALRRARKPEARWREEEVAFRNGEVVLSGTLVLPQRAGRHPALVFTHGSGAEGRGVNREQALKLAGRGVASLIYDKRGVGKSTGDWRSAGLTELAEDALAGLRLLKHRPEVDAKRIGVFGHSQGGWIAPLAASRSPDVAFVAVSAASAINAARQSIFHRANVIRAAGHPEAAVARASELRRQLYETARTGAPRGQLAADVEKVSGEPWFALSALPHPVPLDEKPAAGVIEMLFLEPLPVWERVRVPVLAVWGDKDIVVPVAEGRAMIARALGKGGNRRVTTRVFPNVDHATSIVRAQGDGWDFPRRSAAYADFINDWIVRAAGAGSERRPARPRR